VPVWLAYSCSSEIHYLIPDVSTICGTVKLLLPAGSVMRPLEPVRRKVLLHAGLMAGKAATHWWVIVLQTACRCPPRPVGPDGAGSLHTSRVY
jgi:hypothetical protein